MDSVYGPQILVRTLSKAAETGTGGDKWQYHSRGDRHSKVACWGILFDLLTSCALLRQHVTSGTVGFGINHEMTDFRQDRKKDLDLVLCRPAAESGAKKPSNRSRRSFADLVSKYDIELSTTERALLDSFPVLHDAPVGAVLMALEAKACMTAHGKAESRLYDELSSSHQTVHGSSEIAIAAGMVMVNAATEFISPGRRMKCPHCGQHVSPVNEHDQPADTERVIARVQQLRRRASTREEGFDAIGIVVVDCRNDGTPVALLTAPPAPQPSDTYHYDQMITRLVQLYESRFPRE